MSMSAASEKLMEYVAQLAPGALERRMLLEPGTIVAAKMDGHPLYFRFRFHSAFPFPFSIFS